MFDQTATVEAADHAGPRPTFGQHDTRRAPQTTTVDNNDHAGQRTDRRLFRWPARGRTSQGVAGSVLSARRRHDVSVWAGWAPGVKGRPVSRAPSGSEASGFQQPWSGGRPYQCPHRLDACAQFVPRPEQPRTCGAVSPGHNVARRCCPGAPEVRRRRANRCFDTSWEVCLYRRSPAAWRPRQPGRRSVRRTGKAVPDSLPNAYRAASLVW